MFKTVLSMVRIKVTKWLGLTYTFFFFCVGQYQTFHLVKEMHLKSTKLNSGAISPFSSSFSPSQWLGDSIKVGTHAWHSAVSGWSRGCLLWLQPKAFEAGHCIQYPWPFVRAGSKLASNTGEQMLPQIHTS